MALDREYQVDLTKEVEYDGVVVTSLKIPDNLYIIATMNSADRSIAVLDYAIRRRFAFVKLNPNYEIVKKLSNDKNMGISIDKLHKSLNKRIVDVLGEENLILGQSYFLPKYLSDINGKTIWTAKDLRLVFNYSILPMLEEYTYGNTNHLIQITGKNIASQMYND